MENRFKNMNEHIQPTADLSERVLEQAAAKKRISFRPLVALAAVLVLLIAATPAMAEHVPLVNDLLYTISPELAERYTPVQLGDEDNGITMEVMAASVHDNVAEMVIRIQGEALAGKHVGPILKIKNYHPLTNTNIESLNEYEGLFEDREQGIWYYKFTMTYRDGTNIADILGDKMTVKLSGIQLSSFGYAEGTEFPIILTDYELMTVAADRKVPALNDYGIAGAGYGYAEGYEYWGEQEVYTLMTPGESVYDVTDQLSLTGMAYIDGKLHAQMRAVDQVVGTTVKWGFFDPEFTDAEGNRVTWIYRNSYTIETDGHKIQYYECVYDLPEEELENYTVSVKVIEEGGISCHCSVTFQFTESEYTAEEIG